MEVEDIGVSTTQPLPPPEEVSQAEERPIPEPEAPPPTESGTATVVDLYA